MNKQILFIGGGVAVFACICLCGIAFVGLLAAGDFNLTTTAEIDRSGLEVYETEKFAVGYSPDWILQDGSIVFFYETELEGAIDFRNNVNIANQSDANFARQDFDQDSCDEYGAALESQLNNLYDYATLRSSKMVVTHGRGICNVTLDGELSGIKIYQEQYLYTGDGEVFVLTISSDEDGAFVQKAIEEMVNTFEVL